MTPERRREIWQIILTRIRPLSEQAKSDSEMIKTEEEGERARREEREGRFLAEYVLDEVIRGQDARVAPAPIKRFRFATARTIFGAIEYGLLATKVRGLDDALTQRQLEMARHYGEDGATQLHLKGLALQCNYWENALQGNPSEPLQQFGQSRLAAIRGQIAEHTQPQLPQNHS